MSLKFAAILSLSASLLLAPQADAAGFLIADPTFHPGFNPAVVRPIGRTVSPGGVTPLVRPGTRPGPRAAIGPGGGRIMPIFDPGPTPGPTPVPIPPTVLRGGVSHGLRMQSQDIKVDITDQVAKTYITQTFINETDQNLAGTYLFPLPEDTTFSSFSLHIDGKPVEGKILAAEEARQQYEAIVRQMVDPGLLEYADYKTVRARIFPIPAHGTKKVELEYTQLLKAESGLIKYRFPLKSDSEAAGAIDDTRITVRMSGKVKAGDSRESLRTIWSPSHTVAVDRIDHSKARISYSAKNSVPDKDFLLYYSVSDKDMAASVLTHKLEGEDGYFLLTLSPPLKSSQIVGKDIVLVADTSGSMQGEKMEQCKKALKYVVNSLSPADRFGLVNFSTDAESFKSSLAAATPENKKAAVAFIDDLEARGGTNIGDALHTGISLLKEETTRPAYLVMMTDGEPTVGETSTANILKIAANKKDIRLFDFGVGYDVNTRLLNRLSESHHGTAQYLEPGENLETALSSFYDKIKSPVLSDVNISYNGVTVKDTYPRQVKDVFAGSQVLLLGRYKGSGQANVVVSGKINGGVKSFTFPLGFEASQTGHSFLPKLWAMRRIAYLTEVAQENGNTKEVVDEIVALSKKHGIISAFTSFLATDPNENHRLANNVPAGRPVPMAENWRSFSGLVGGAGGAGVVRKESARYFSSVDTRPRVSRSASMPVAPAAQARADDKDLRTNWGHESIDETRDSLSAKIAAAPVSGRQAVEREKKMAAMKSLSLEQKNSELGVKTVEEKTFYLRNGYWTDSEYKSEKVDEVQFGSERYFALTRTVPNMTRYLALGRQVIVVIKGHAYKIVAAKALH
ncbi:MAG: VIT domain-containing protein [Candidatus Melainabacteria bacterium]|nr:VIT domain-containing protein [Candidatus Melainabacteria bacterium]